MYYCIISFTMGFKQVYPQWAYSCQDHHDRLFANERKASYLASQRIVHYMTIYFCFTLWYYTRRFLAQIYWSHYHLSEVQLWLLFIPCISVKYRTQLTVHGGKTQTNKNTEEEQKPQWVSRVQMDDQPTNLDCWEHNPQPPRPPRPLQPCPSSAAPCGSTRHPSLLPRPPCSVLLTLALEFCNTTYILTSNLILQYCTNALN